MALDHVILFMSIPTLVNLTANTRPIRTFKVKDCFYLNELMKYRYRYRVDWTTYINPIADVSSALSGGPIYLINSVDKPTPLTRRNIFFRKNIPLSISLKRF